MRILCLGLDGADHELVRELMAQRRLPTLSRIAREGAFGPLRSTIPAVTPTAWSSFLTGLNPAGHGIFNFSANPNRGLQRIESAASRGGEPFWHVLGAAGMRSAFVTIPFTYPPEPVDGILVTGYGGPIEPEILPATARERISATYPNLVTSHHPMAERWWEDFDGFTDKLVAHVDEIAGVARLALELEPDLRLLCVDFMSSDFAGHLAYHRYDATHPAHDPAEAGDELVRVYEAVDRACGELIEDAATRFDEEPTVLLLSDHGMKPIHWVFHVSRWLEEAGYLRYRRRSLQRFRGGRLAYAASVDQRLARTRRRYGRALDHVPGMPKPVADRAFADIDFGSTRAYAYGTGGQIFAGETTGAREDEGFLRELETALASITHPESGEPAFDVRRKEELYRGEFVEKAPELVILPRDERIYVDPSRRRWERPFQRHERLEPGSFFGYSGHHGLDGILAASGPGIRVADVPTGSEITQMAGTILALLGLSADLDGPPIDAILDEARGDRETVAAGGSRAPRSDEPVYSEDEEALMTERLRDLGYE